MDRQNVARRRLMGRPDPAAVTLLAAFCAAWAAGMYRSQGDVMYVLGGVLAAASALTLIVYGAAFQRKMRRL